MNQLRRTTQPTTNGPISPLRMARATSLATIRQVDTQPASTAHTMSTMQTATLHGIVILAPPQPPPRRQFPEHRPCNQSAIMVEPRRRSNEFRRIHDSDRKRTHFLSCRCRQHSARKNRNKLRLAPVLVPIDPERESARILSTSNRRKRFASPRRCLIKRWGSISLPSLPPNPRFALPTPVWPATKAGNLQQDQDRTETTFVIAVAPRTSTNPPLNDQLQSHHLRNGFFNQRDNFF